MIPGPVLSSGEYKIPSDGTSRDFLKPSCGWICIKSNCNAINCIGCQNPYILSVRQPRYFVYIRQSVEGAQRLSRPMWCTIKVNITSLLDHNFIVASRSPEQTAGGYFDTITESWGGSSDSTVQLTISFRDLHIECAELCFVNWSSNKTIFLIIEALEYRP